MKFQKLFNIWSQRALSLFGKITIAKTLGLSKRLFASACIRTPPYVLDTSSKLDANFKMANKASRLI